MATIVTTMSVPVKHRSVNDEASMTRYFCLVRAMMPLWAVAKSASARSNSAEAVDDRSQSEESSSELMVDDVTVESSRRRVRRQSRRQKRHG